MQKRIISTLLALLLLCGAAYAAGNTYTLTDLDYSIVVNGETMTWSDAVPMQYNGRTMLPLRAMGDALGVNITWNDAKRQAEVNTIDLEKLKDSCVMVKNSYQDGSTIYYMQGSGVFIDYNKILTCDHIVKGYTDYAGYYDDSEEKNIYSLSSISEAEDAAILIPGDKTTKPVKLGDSDEVKPGDKIYVISSPDGKKNTVTSGTVKRLGGNDIDGLKFFITTAVAKAGSMGGACFNTKGELIGIVEGINNYGTLTNITPINDIRKALAS